MNLYCSLGEPILLGVTTYIGYPSDQYSFIQRAILLCASIIRRLLHLQVKKKMGIQKLHLKSLYLSATLVGCI